MKLANLLVAVDDSAAGRNAARFAAHLAGFLGGELTVLNVLPAAPEGRATDDRYGGGVHAVLGEKIFAAHPGLAVEVAEVRGVPQIEIPRFAEQMRAGLIVLGRKPRSRAARLILGDTADAVVRRTRIPCLLVPAELKSMRRVLVALDGTGRGLAALRTATNLAEEAHLELSAVTVDSSLDDEEPLISRRSEELAATVERHLEAHTGVAREGVKTSALHVRQGEVVDEVVAEVVEGQADILAIGFHPGGPVLVADDGSVARRLVHTAPCAVLTVPL